MNEILTLTNVTKSFQHKTAVDNVSFSIGKGEVEAILSKYIRRKQEAVR